VSISKWQVVSCLLDGGRIVCGEVGPCHHPKGRNTLSAWSHGTATLFAQQGGLPSLRYRQILFGDCNDPCPVLSMQVTRFTRGQTFSDESVPSLWEQEGEQQGRGGARRRPSWSYIISFIGGCAAAVVGSMLYAGFRARRRRRSWYSPVSEPGEARITVPPLRIQI
jgi:hypothetical protein